MVGLIPVICLVAPSFTAQVHSGAPSDVPRNHWAFEAVDEMFKLGLLDGYPDGTFNGAKSALNSQVQDAKEANP